MILCSLLGVSCGGSATPTTPSVSPTPVPPPNLTGTWIGTVVEETGDRRTFDVTATLTQDAGSTTVKGTIVKKGRISQFLETITVGTQNGYAVELETVYHDITPPLTYRYHGQLDASGSEMHGTEELVGSSSRSTWSVHR